MKRSIRAELRILRNRAALEGRDPEVRAEIACRLQVIMAQAKVEGMIVDKKQVAKVAFSIGQLPRDPYALSKPELDQALDWLPWRVRLSACGVDSG